MENLRQTGTVGLFQFNSFLQTGLVVHGITARTGGTGRPPYDGLNLAFHVGDDPASVLANRQLVCSALGAAMSDLVTGRQVHGARVEVVGRGQAGRGALDYESALPDTDGLVTDTPGLLLATFYADCVPIFVVDPVRRVIANVHAGWKGTAARIAAAALKIMRESYGTDPADCLAGIGPSIGPCCYEVDESLIRIFREEFAW